ncbi:MAG: hypothetical protein HY520_02395, partial [Candidatus Aenigmarchaeota archaeon]|nr:hypothetical protein [Candidatus Aenigmarchaeota archaeon]
QNAQDNIIFKNNILNSTGFQAFDNGNTSWDNGFSGNHWSDFYLSNQGCRDLDNNSICDGPYNISGGNNRDNFPYIPLF